LLGYSQIHGAAVTYRRKTAPVYDPETGVPAQTTYDFSLVGIPSAYNADEVGEGIDVEDRKFLMPASQLTGDPTTEDLLVIAGQIWEIVNSKRIDKHAEGFAHLLQIRRVT
jgi:hypothetical protein